MRPDELHALFLLAGIAIKREIEIPNQYCGSNIATADCPICKERPWWLVETEFCIIKIGWRKRVISIDWSTTNVRGQVTKDPTTASDQMVHAWSWGKAVDYLEALRELAP